MRSQLLSLKSVNYQCQNDETEFCCFTLLNGLFQPSIFSIFVFSRVIINMFCINFNDDWIWTLDFMYQKESIWQLSHKHFFTFKYYGINDKFLPTIIVNWVFSNSHILYIKYPKWQVQFHKVKILHQEKQFKYFPRPFEFPRTCTLWSIFYLFLCVIFWPFIRPFD